jgi:hypothetical protein
MMTVVSITLAECSHQLITAFLDEFHEGSDYDRIVHYDNSEDDFD